jgi:hypothetical protein
MERNKQGIYYALFSDKTPILDFDGFETGDYESGYSNPVPFRIRVSPNKGENSEQAFGKLLDYDRVLSTSDHDFQIDEFSILWIGRVPEIKEDGSTDTPHDYTVARVSKDLNEWLFAIKRVV